MTSAGIPPIWSTYKPFKKETFGPACCVVSADLDAFSSQIFYSSEGVMKRTNGGAQMGNDRSRRLYWYTKGIDFLSDSGGPAGK